jgi:hypothetical protein
MFVKSVRDSNLPLLQRSYIIVCCQCWCSPDRRGGVDVGGETFVGPGEVFRDGGTECQSSLSSASKLESHACIGQGLSISVVCQMELCSRSVTENASIESIALSWRR